MKLRDYQEEALQELENNINIGGTNIAMALPTSFGKTITISQFIKDEIEMGKTVVFMMNLKSLVSQTMQTLKSMGVSYKVIASEHDGKEFDPRATVTIAMQQTLYARLDKYSDMRCDILVVDEYHISYDSTSMDKIKKMLKPKVTVGLTATPIDSKGRVLSGVDVIETTTVKDLTARGFLTPCRTFVTSVGQDLDLTGLGKSGDYSEPELEEVVNTEAYNSGVVKLWETTGERRKTIVFASSIAHSVSLAKAFEAKDINAVAYHSKINNKERSHLMQEFRDNKIQVMVSVSALIAGFDLPDIGCAIACRPTKTLRLTRQAIGRVIRLHETKKDAIFIDCAKWTEHHGLYDEPLNLTKVTDEEHKANVKNRKISNVGILLQSNKSVEVESRESIQFRVKEVKEVALRNAIASNSNANGGRTNEQESSRVLTLIRMYDASRSLEECLNIGCVLYELLYANPTSESTKKWILENWVDMQDNPLYEPIQHRQMFKAFKSRLKNIIKDKKKIVSLKYFYDFMIEKVEENQYGY